MYLFLAELVFERADACLQLVVGRLYPGGLLLLLLAAPLPLSLQHLDVPVLVLYGGLQAVDRVRELRVLGFERRKLGFQA